ncbi:MAG: 50S ribosomal protein L13 [Candidatus Thorarchaeota archaeon]
MMSQQDIKVFDAEQMVIGRLLTVAAKAALMGSNVVIVNAEKAIVTGDRRAQIESFKRKREIRANYNPRKGPFHERRPDKLVRKMIRGMLAWPTPRGKAAYKRVSVHVGVPPEYSAVEKIVLEDARYDSLRNKCITIADLCYELGWRNRGAMS